MHNLSKVFVIGLIAVITTVTVWGDSFLKKAGNYTSYFTNKDFYIGLFVYSITAFMWVYVYKYAKFSVSGAVYSILSMITFVILGVFMFKETLSALELVGLGMGIGALIILSRFI